MKIRLKIIGKGYMIVDLRNMPLIEIIKLFGSLSFLTFVWVVYLFLISYIPFADWMFGQMNIDPYCNIAGVIKMIFIVVVSVFYIYLSEKISTWIGEKHESKL